ncbi:Glycyl-tRNA synthetase/DNA polymerase subunit gamma-2 [Phytophthora cactorum]|nr:Glycyl-tRNA synthetase/DNA polymerase subunit gamma-2 [Phytophthora cactorum]
MSSTPVVDLDALRASVTRQGAQVRELKQKGAAAEDVKAAVDELKKLKLELETQTALQGPAEDGLSKSDKKALDDLLLRKMFVVPSFEIYGGVGGFYDFGPPACSLKSNLLQFWRRHFVFADKLLEVECTNLMPEVVLKTSGHVDRFTDLMVKCTKSGECYRADKLLEDHAEREKHEMHATMAESYSPEEIHASPGTGADLSFPIPFNLMFKCAIGPEGGLVGYLRPETAQGIFLNFRRLLEYNAGKVPFGCAQIGSAFRNEISPRAGLLRVREFQQAEIEFFVNPKDKSHAKFSTVKDLELPLLTKTNQLTHGKAVQMTCGAASLAYYLARTYKFCKAIGIDLERLRFRQHLNTEMAHYATDCWDLEIKLSSGWVECAGHADRSCYDLTVHAKKSKVEMVGTHKFDKPEKRQIVEIKPNKGKMGRTFKAEVATILEALETLKDDVPRAQAFEDELASKGEATLGPLCDGKQFTLQRDMVAIKVVEKMVSEEKFVPSVIEPSFGIGRILTAVFEHNFSTREGDEKRGVMSFSPLIAPIKVSVLPLSNNPAFEPFATELENVFVEEGLECKVDTSSVAIGRKYARADELGIPFNVTIDFDTVKDRVVTLRERDSTAQVRIPMDTIGAEVNKLVKGSTTWEQILEQYPKVTGTESLNISGVRRLDELDLGADVAIACPLEDEPVVADASTESSGPQAIHLRVMAHTAQSLSRLCGRRLHFLERAAEEHSLLWKEEFAGTFE